MKINEKHLVYYASFDDSVDSEGWLLKKGEVNTSYQKRWCILKGNLFLYFEKKSDKEPMGVIILENCFVQLAEGGDSLHTFSINFTGEGSRVYKFAAKDDNDCTAWVKALSISSYRYLEILVKGLENDVASMKLAKAEREHQLHFSDSCGDISIADCSQCRDENFSTLHTKASSYNNILEAVGNFDDDVADDNTHLSVQISRARSSSDIATLSQPKYLSIVKSTSLVKLKGGKWKQKRSKTQKFSPKLSKNGSKTAKHEPTYLSVEPQEQIVRLRAEALVPLSDDLLIFSRMHEDFRKQIASFISA